MHPLASTWIHGEFERRITSAPRSFVLLLAGGGGSGKSSLVANELADVVEDCETEVDGVMGDLELSVNRMEQILDSGRHVIYVYVWAPFPESYKRVKACESRTGRPVPKEVLARAHVGSQETFSAIHDAYGDLEEVAMYAFDAATVPPRHISIDAVRAMRYIHAGGSVEETAARLIASLSRTEHDDSRRPPLQ
jgi:hypothetical protein